MRSQEVSSVERCCMSVENDCLGGVHVLEGASAFAQFSMGTSDCQWSSKMGQRWQACGRKSGVSQEVSSAVCCDLFAHSGCLSDVCVIGHALALTSLNMGTGDCRRSSKIH